jgi:hypothetical protein
MTQTLGPHAGIEKLVAALNEVREALDACWDYFDDRAEGVHDADGFVANEELQLLTIVSRALNIADAVAARAQADTQEALHG